MQGRLVKSFRGFPTDRAIWEAPEALRQLHCVVARKVGVPRARLHIL